MALHFIHRSHLHAVEPVEQRLRVDGQPEFGEAARHHRELEGEGHEQQVEHAGEQQHAENVLSGLARAPQAAGAPTATARGTHEAMNIPISCGQRNRREVDLECGKKRIHTVHTKLEARVLLVTCACACGTQQMSTNVFRVLVIN